MSDRLAMAAPRRNDWKTARRITQSVEGSRAMIVAVRGTCGDDETGVRGPDGQMSARAMQAGRRLFRVSLRTTQARRQAGGHVASAPDT